MSLSMGDVHSWLKSLGLGQYADAFARNEIGPEHLADLDHDILKEIGVGPVGHRMTILKAASTLVEQPETRSSANPLATHPTETAEAERRQLTIMFCDLVGSVNLGERMDVEDYRDLLARFRTVAVEAVERFDGFIARHQGDGLLAYFGYPQAGEDDAERAVHSGLDVVSRIEKLSGPLGTALQVRVGIATGPAIVGDLLETGGAPEIAALGSTPNLAARLQGKAKANSVLIAETTAQLVEGRFQLSPLELALKGMETRTSAFCVEGTRDRRSVLDSVEGSALTQLVGREEERALLVGRWRRAVEGEGQVVLLSGEPGVGKSRLAHEFIEAIGSGARRVVTLFGSPLHREIPLHPFLALLERALTLPPTSTVQAVIHTIEVWLSKQGLDAETLTPSFAALLAPEDHPTDDPDRQKRQIFDALLEWLVHGQAKPALIVFEDAHWMDPSTVELVGELIERIREHPMCLLVTHRPEFRAPWGDHGHQTTWSLGGLSGREVGSLARFASGGADLSDKILNHIVSRADGLPLFAEELTKALIESSHDADRGAESDAEVVPFTLQDSLMARLDRLGPSKRVAQNASILGRGFTADLLLDIDEFDASELESHLATLTQSGLVLRDRNRGNDSYVFKHALVRDAAYGSMLHRRRREAHTRVAAVLEARNSGLAQKQPEILAHHVEQGGDAERALMLWSAAGRRSLEGSHYVESVGSFRRALNTLEGRPQSNECDREELDVRIALIAPLVAAYGFGAAAVEENAARALELCDELGNDELRFVAWYAHWVNLRVRGKANALLSIARALRAHPAASTTQHQALGLRMEAQALFDIGRPREALPCIEEGITLLRQLPDRAFVYGTEPLVQCRFYLALCHWLTGDPETARRVARETLADAERLGHTNTLAVCLGHVGFLLNALARDRETLHKSMTRLQAIADEKSMPQWQGISRFGLALCIDDPTESVAALQEGLARLSQIDVYLWRPIMLAWLAERQVETDPAAALGSIGQAKTQAARDGECWSDVEVLRVEARVLRVLGREEDARVRITAAIDAAHTAGNHCWELRCQADAAEAAGESAPSANALSRCFGDRGGCSSTT
jgi:class 3 adenylate cyclase